MAGKAVRQGEFNGATLLHNLTEPGEGTDVEALAARIEADIPNASAMTGAEFDGVVGSSVAIFNAIIVYE